MIAAILSDFTSDSYIFKFDRRKLLEEIPWEKARDYRAGGRGRENVLTAEGLMGLDFLPRSHFLGAVIRAAQGADVVRHEVATEVEELQMQFLPGNFSVGSGSRRPQFVVQPDAIFETTNTYSQMHQVRKLSSRAIGP